MGINKKYDVLGIAVNGEIACEDCMTDVEWCEIKEENLILKSKTEKSDDLFFCDRCHVILT